MSATLRLRGETVTIASGGVDVSSQPSGPYITADAYAPLAQLDGLATYTYEADLEGVVPLAKSDIRVGALVKLTEGGVAPLATADILAGYIVRIDGRTPPLALPTMEGELYANIINVRMEALLPLPLAEGEGVIPYGMLGDAHAPFPTSEIVVNQNLVLSGNAVAPLAALDGYAGVPVELHGELHSPLPRSVIVLDHPRPDPIVFVDDDVHSLLPALDGELYMPEALYGDARAPLAVSDGFVEVPLYILTGQSQVALPTVDGLIAVPLYIDANPRLPMPVLDGFVGEPVELSGAALSPFPTMSGSTIYRHKATSDYDYDQEYDIRMSDSAASGAGKRTSIVGIYPL